MSSRVISDPSNGRLSLEPALFPVSLRYHSIPIERLAEVTTRRLVEAGLPASCLGRLQGRRVTLTGCVVLPSFARGALPPGLGGDALDFAASASTADLIDRAVRRSPLRGRVPSTPVIPAPGAGGWGGGVGGGGAEGEPSPPSAAARRVRRELVTEEEELEREEARFDDAHALEAAARERLAAARRDTLRSAASARAASAPSAAPAAEEFARASSEPSTERASDEPSGTGPDRRMAAALDAVAEAPRSEAEVDALAAVEAAGAERVRLGIAAAARRGRVWELEETLSGLSVAPGAPPSPSRGGGGIVDLACEQAHLRAATDNMGLASAAIAALTSTRAAYPLIFAALLEASAGVEARSASLTDLPLLALVPAVLALRSQLHGLDLLRQAARLHATAAGPAGAIAAAAFDEDVFDYHAAEAIATGAVGLDVSPLDTCLGVLPLAQLGLHFWYANHVFVPGDGSRLLQLAQTVTFIHGGRLDLIPSYCKDFLPVWTKALQADDDMPYADIYFALVQAITRSIHAPGSERVIASVAGTPTPWPAFAMDTHTSYQENSCGHIDGRAARLPSLLDLRTLVRTLDDYNRACIKAHPDADTMRPPQLGGVSSSVRRVADAPPGFVAATALPPPALVPRPRWSTKPADGRKGGRGASSGPWPRGVQPTYPSAHGGSPSGPSTPRPSRLSVTLPTVWRKCGDGSYAVDSLGARIPKSRVQYKVDATGNLLLDALGSPMPKKKVSGGHRNRERTVPAALGATPPRPALGLADAVQEPVASGTPPAPPLLPSAPSAHRPDPYWCPELHVCGNSNRGCDVLCTDCTRRSGSATLLRDTFVCPQCQCLFRWECPNAHTARCGARSNSPGVVRADPVVHRDLILKVLSRLVGSLLASAKRAQRCNHAPKAQRDGLVVRIIGELRSTTAIGSDFDMALVAYEPRTAPRQLPVPAVPAVLAMPAMPAVPAVPATPRRRAAPSSRGSSTRRAPSCRARRPSSRRRTRASAPSSGASRRWSGTRPSSRRASATPRRAGPPPKPGGAP